MDDQGLWLLVLLTVAGIVVLAGAAFATVWAWPRLVLRVAWGASLAVLIVFWGVLAAAVVWGIVSVVA